MSHLSGSCRTLSKLNNTCSAPFFSAETAAAVNIHTTGQGDPADVVFLSYEAMFCCLRALVYAKGYREFGLRCLLLACDGPLCPHRPARRRAPAQVRAGPAAQVSPAEAVESLLGVRQADARIARAVSRERLAFT